MARMSAAGIHRIFLCDKAGRLVRIISLSDILARLHAAVISGADTARNPTVVAPNEP